MRAMKRWILAVVATAAMASAGAARAAEFVVHPGNDNRVVFVSTATMETFEGKTNRMEGHLTVNPAAIGDSIAVHLEVDLASLDGASVHGPADAKLEPGKPVTFDVEGTFTLHGVSRRLRIQIEAAYSPAGPGRIAFRTTFPVGLSDYNISRPQFLFLKLAETQQVKVSGVAVAAP
jgi:polyisoprenoid-binding protein YceI